MTLQEIQSRNYAATVSRGLITPKTTDREFVSKLFEECHEVDNFLRFTGNIDPFEIADVIIVCLNMAKHFDIDIESALEQKTVINEKRGYEIQST